MNKNEKFVITINREFGSGGHAIGEELARQLGVRFIDKQIVEAVANKFNITPEEASIIENRRPSWWEDFAQFYSNFMSMNEYFVDAQNITSRQLFLAQKAAIREIAYQESCVIVGRCGFDIIRDESNSLKLFIHAPKDVRIKRIMERYNVNEIKAKELIADNDYTRELFTKTFTGCNWYDARNYDLALDVKNFGVQGAVEFLLNFIG